MHGALWRCFRRRLGGIAFFPKSIEQVDEVAAEVARDIRKSIHDWVSFNQVDRRNRASGA